MNQKQTGIFVRVEYFVPYETGKSQAAFETAEAIAAGKGVDGAVILSATTPEPRRIAVKPEGSPE
jgi:hypothetical protein